LSGCRPYPPLSIIQQIYGIRCRTLSASVHEACNDRAEVGEGSEQGRGADHLLGSCIHVATYIVVVVPPAGQTAAPAERFRTGGGGGSGRGTGIGGGGSMIGGGFEGSGGGTGGVPGGGIGCGPWARIAPA
jgi:hypothetical protein